MLKGSPLQDLFNSAPANTKVTRQLVLSDATKCISLPNEQGVLILEFSPLATVANWLASLFLHIGMIVGIRAQKEVSGIDTSSVVTGVAHTHAYWDRTLMKFPGNAMGVRTLPKEGHAAITGCGAEVREPFPTVVGTSAINTRPESNGKVWARRELARVMAGTVTGGCEDNRQSAPAGAGDRGRIVVHRKLTPFGARPRAALTVPGHFAARIIPQAKGLGVWREASRKARALAEKNTWGHVVARWELMLKELAEGRDVASI